MNRKGFELAISTIVLIIIGISVLIGLILFVRNGFSFLNESTEPFIESESNSAIKQACELACTAEDIQSFCCTSFDLDGQELFCINSSVNVNCFSIDCSKFNCS